MKKFINSVAFRCKSYKQQAKIVKYLLERGYGPEHFVLDALCSFIIADGGILYLSNTLMAKVLIVKSKKEFIALAIMSNGAIGETPGEIIVDLANGKMLMTVHSNYNPTRYRKASVSEIQQYCWKQKPDLELAKEYLQKALNLLS